MRLMPIQIRKVFFQRLTNITGPTQTALPRTDSNFVAVATDPNLVDSGHIWQLHFPFAAQVFR